MAQYGASPIASLGASRYAETCKTKVRSKWKPRTNYAGYADWTVLANGNRWTIAAFVAVAAKVLAACRCNSWAAHAGTGQYDLFARHRTVLRRQPIGFTHTKAESRQTVRLTIPSATCCPHQICETCSRTR